MVRRTFAGMVCAGLIAGASVPAALANGRPPGTSTITFRQNDDQHVVAGMTFGLVVSADGGATWHWMCERAIQYGGIFDPVYVATREGNVFATTPDTLEGNLNGCEFVPTALGTKVVSTLALGPDNAVYAAAADPADSRIYKSTDGGVTFPGEANPGQAGDWWSGLGVAPSDPQRVYLAGHRLVGGTRTQLLFRSDDGGATFDPLPMTGLTTTEQSEMEVVGIKHDDPDTVYLRVTKQSAGAVSDAIYRSTDGGMSWTMILSKPDTLSFLVRANGDLVAVADAGGMFVSTAPSNGAAWTTLSPPLTANCVEETEDGEVWVCTQNLGPEDAAIMKSRDLMTWTTVLRYQDVDGPVDCPVGTLQRDLCVEQRLVTTCATEWCCLRAQLGITADPTMCPADVIPDYAQPSDGDGCCQSGVATGPTTAALLTMGLWLVGRRRRR